MCKHLNVRGNTICVTISLTISRTSKLILFYLLYKPIVNGEVHSYYFRTKTQINKPKLTLEGLLMTIFYFSEFKSKL